MTFSRNHDRRPPGVRRIPSTHIRGGDRRPLCGANGKRPVFTNDIEPPTCKRCRDALVRYSLREHEDFYKSQTR